MEGIEERPPERTLDVIVTIHCRVTVDPEDAGPDVPVERVVLDTVESLKAALVAGAENGFSHPVIPYGAEIHVQKAVGAGVER